MNTKLPAALVALARKEVGTEEVDGTNCGPRVNEYKAAYSTTGGAALVVEQK